ncbi:MAG: ATP-binding cassette domain-containing protein [Bacteroidia bacterium]|nr:ATP-binding cassette domain-containing protein [Bacteroidia bacterium]
MNKTPFYSYLHPKINPLQTVLDIQNLTRHFGKIHAVDGISFSVEKGSVYGLLGPNGSGKTTTLGIVLGVIRADSGAYSWYGEAPSPQVLRRIGAVLEQPNFFPYLSGDDNLKIVADIKGVPYTRVEEVLTLTGLSGRGVDAFGKYSLGMKQRLAIAAAMISEPEVLVLDEPTNGLDPQGIADIRALISSIAQNGTTILLASHLLDEVEKVCSHLGILKNGKLLYSGPVEQMLNQGQSEYLELLAEDMKQLFAVIQTYPGVKEVKKIEGKMAVFFEEKPDVKSLNQFLIGEGVVITHLALKKRSLESQFLDLIKNKENS